MINLDEVKAGEYELVALRWDQHTSKPGEPFTFVRHRRGDRVNLNEEDARRLVAAGAVVKPPPRTAADATYTEGDDPGGVSIKVLQQYVGTDAARAAAVLQLEQARGDSARKSLVEWLTGVSAAAPPSGDGSDGEGDSGTSDQA